MAHSARGELCYAGKPVWRTIHLIPLSVSGMGGTRAYTTSSNGAVLLAPAIYFFILNLYVDFARDAKVLLLFGYFHFHFQLRQFSRNETKI